MDGIALRTTFLATILALVMSPVGMLRTGRIGFIALVLLSVSLVILLAHPTSAYEEPVKAPDLTDYVSLYKAVYLDIVDNEKSIKEYKKELEDKSKPLDEILSIKEKISALKLENQGLWENLSEIERLNIESYKLDKKTQKLFDEAEDIIKDHFLGINGVYDVFTETKYRKLIVFVDPGDFANSDYPHGIGAFIDEIQKSVDVDVEVHVAKFIQTHSTGLYKQIQNGIENKHLECSNPEHNLVVRLSLQFACVSEESASKTGWKKVDFSEDNDMIVNYMPLVVKVDGKEFYINATLKNGLIQKTWKEYGELFLKINTSDDGEAKLNIPMSFFPLPENSSFPKIYVTENLEKGIIPDVKFKPDKYVVEFSFSDNDPEIAIGRGYVLN